MIIVVTFSALIAIYLLTYSMVILGSYTDTEDRIVGQDMERVITAIADDVNHLDSVANEWSNTDLIICFLNQSNKKDIETMVNDEAFERLQFNLIGLYDRNNNLSYGALYDLDLHESSSIPNDYNEIIGPYAGYSHEMNPAEGVMGIISMPPGPMLVSARPVYCFDDGTPEYLGTLIMGRHIDGRLRSRLSGITGFNINILSDSGDLGEKIPLFSKYDSNISFLSRMDDDVVAITAPVEIEPFSEDTLVANILITDVYGNTAFVIETYVPREIYGRGKESTLYSMGIFIASTAILGLVVLFLIERNVLSRIFFLSTSIDSIRKRKSTAMRVEEEGSDEISSLASNINGMLDELEKSEKKLQTRLNDSEEKNMFIFDSAEDMVFIVDISEDLEPGKFLEVNRTAISVLGYSKEELLSMTPEDIVPEIRELYDSEEDGGPGSPNRRFEINIRTRDGREIPCEVTTHLFHNFGKTAVLGIARDITERKEIENLKIDTIRKMERNMEQFATLNDQLRNPLQVIVGQVLLGPDCKDEVILGQVEEINNIVREIDQGWMESAKIREFLMKYYGIGSENGENKK